VRISWWMRTLRGISAPRGANLICERCAGKVRRGGVVALIGLTIISCFTLLVLHVAKHHF
jgi:hypothetical protein